MVGFACVARLGVATAARAICKRNGDHYCYAHNDDLNCFKTTFMAFVNAVARAALFSDLCIFIMRSCRSGGCLNSGYWLICVS